MQLNVTIWHHQMSSSASASAACTCQGSTNHLHMWLKNAQCMREVWPQLPCRKLCTVHSVHVMKGQHRYSSVPALDPVVRCTYAALHFTTTIFNLRLGGSTLNSIKKKLLYSRKFQRVHVTLRTLTVSNVTFWRVFKFLLKLKIKFLLKLNVFYADKAVLVDKNTIT